MATQEKQAVLQAINDLGRRVTAADVATKTGLPILVVSSELNKVASETEGHLEVSTTGDIAYKFNLGFQNIYLTKGLLKVLQNVGNQLFKIGYFLLRISFGIMLILSFLIIIVLIIAVMIYLSRMSDRDDDGGGFDLSFFDFMILRDLLWWGAWSFQPDYYYYDRPSTRVAPKRNFLYDVFSFLFGDGSPNLHLEERKWQLIAQVIKANNGVVTAEQLAPYTGADPQNEDGVLPVLVRFDGKPEVTEKGNIVYQFPSLQVSATDFAKQMLPPYLNEFTWQFTSAPAESLIPVYILAGVNFLGSWWLNGLISQGVPVLVHFAGLVHALVAYGTFFVAVPLARFFVQNWLNARIEDRNERRDQYAQLVSNPSPELQTKLIEARDFTIKEKQLTGDKVVFTTERDALEQEFDASP